MQLLQARKFRPSSPSSSCVIGALVASRPGLGIPSGVLVRAPLNPVIDRKLLWIIAF